MLNAFTVDVEDYYHVTGFARDIAPARWSSFSSRVVGSTERLIELLDEDGTKATFFVLGWVAERHPELVRRIASAGHEIGCHSHAHRLIYTMSAREFRDDLRRATGILEGIAGHPVRLYRAPSFSITRRSLWALEVLAEEGYAGDSSVVPMRRGRSGVQNAPRFPHQIETASGTIWEFPPATRRWFGANLAIGGGGYFRLYPYRFTRRSLDGLNRREQQPFAFYVHPWEIDVEQPRLTVSSRMNRFRHYVNLRSTEPRLRRLLADFRFSTLSNSLETCRARGEDLPSVRQFEDHETQPAPAGIDRTEIE